MTTRPWSSGQEESPSRKDPPFQCKVACERSIPGIQVQHPSFGCSKSPNLHTLSPCNPIHDHMEPQEPTEWVQAQPLHELAAHIQAPSSQQQEICEQKHPELEDLEAQIWVPALQQLENDEQGEAPLELEVPTQAPFLLKSSSPMNQFLTDYESDNENSSMSSEFKNWQKWLDVSQQHEDTQSEQDTESESETAHMDTYLESDNEVDNEKQHEEIYEQDFCDLKLEFENPSQNLYNFHDELYGEDSSFES